MSYFVHMIILGIINICHYLLRTSWSFHSADSVKKEDSCNNILYIDIKHSHIILLCYHSVHLALSLSYMLSNDISNWSRCHVSRTVLNTHSVFTCATPCQGGISCHLVSVCLSVYVTSRHCIETTGRI